MKSKGMIEFIAIPLVVLIASMLVIFFDFFYVSFQTATTDVLSAEASSILNNLVTGFTVWDQVMLLITIGLFASVIVSGLLIKTHPVMFIASLFMLFIVTAVSPAFSNMFFAMAENSLLTSTVNNFPLIVWIFQYLPVWILGFGVLALVTWYPRRNDA